VDRIPLAQDMDQSLVVVNTGNFRVSEEKLESQKKFMEFVSTRRSWLGKNLG